jgi:hypothetical protein
MSAIGLATKGMITIEEMGPLEKGGGDGAYSNPKKDPKVYFKSLGLNEAKEIVADMEKKIESKIKIKLTLEDDETTSDK